MEDVNSDQVRHRRNSKPDYRYEPEDWDDSLPYGGKVYIARRQKPDAIIYVFIEVLVICGGIALMYFAWYYPAEFHFHAHHIYAHISNDPHAQHSVAERYLHGKGVDRDSDLAVHWFRKAAEQGHPHASYNLAVSHINGHTEDLEPGRAHDLIRHAAANGVHEAHKAMKYLCYRGYNYCGERPEEEEEEEIIEENEEYNEQYDRK